MFQRPTRAMRRDLTQLICALGGLALGLVAPMADVGPLVEASRVATMLFTVGFGVISLVSIIYSMLFLVVQFSASTFTPRLAFFRDEPIVWRAFAFAVGVFVFCVVAGLAIGARDRVSALLPCVAMVLTLVALTLMRSLQTKAFDSIQLAHSLTAIATRAHRSYDTLYVRPYDPGRTAAPPPPGTGPTGAGAGTGTGTGTGTTVRWSGPATVVQQIDVPALVAVAQRHDCAIDFRVTPGRTVSRGMALAEVTGAELPEEVLREAVVTGVERTFHQDPELPFRLLVDIALRALSPAVHDPATAVESMDRLEDLLTRLADRELDFGRFADGAGRVRVTVPVPDWEQYVRTACDDIAVAAAGSPMALRRLRDLLGRLLERSPEDRRAVVRERLEWAERTGSAAYPLIWTPREECS
ncbi:DUF2254 domain-containing protein [Streptomyces sp. MB09-01]|uniref:DUF2254 family protein n=1 Tax=Streptomyces sp. MB09-01 TaxID=3028666 RepID=UPI0029BD70EF|nr:DUF2254 family protein [Streptomyces sp. MB09-01]MDX3538461.1 DUF2254 domain-containing protein [Streptomyces sp. MB09-01]